MHTGHRQKMRTQRTEKIKLPDKTMKIRKTISTLTVTKPFSPTFGEYLYFVKKKNLTKNTISEEKLYKNRWLKRLFLYRHY